MITSVAEFARYWEGVRRRTWTAVDRVEPGRLDWSPRPGEMTCGEIVRHLAGKIGDSVMHDRLAHARAGLDSANGHSRRLAQPNDRFRLQPGLARATCTTPPSRCQTNGT